MGQRINAALRAVVADRSREQIIGGDFEEDDEGNPITDDEGNTQVFATETRTEMLAEVLAAIRLALSKEDEPFGIEMLDVRIKRADFPTEVSGRIFERMRSERERSPAVSEPRVKRKPATGAPPPTGTWKSSWRAPTVTPTASVVKARPRRLPSLPMP